MRSFFFFLTVTGCIGGTAVGGNSRGLVGFFVVSDKAGGSGCGWEGRWFGFPIRPAGLILGRRRGDVAGVGQKGIAIRAAQAKDAHNQSRPEHGRRGMWGRFRPRKCMAAYPGPWAEV